MRTTRRADPPVGIQRHAGHPLVVRGAIASQDSAPDRRSGPSYASANWRRGRTRFQMDSVNVLVRAYQVPAFARLGPYRMEALDSLAYGKRELFEYGDTRGASRPFRYIRSCGIACTS